MPRPIAVAFLAVFLFALGYQLRGLWGDYRVFDKKFTSLSATVAALETENKGLEGKLRHYSVEDNLVKEVKARFNYRLPDERLMIVAPEGD